MLDSTITRLPNIYGLPVHLSPTFQITLIVVIDLDRQHGVRSPGVPFMYRSPQNFRPSITRLPNISDHADCCDRVGSPARSEIIRRTLHLLAAAGHGCRAGLPVSHQGSQSTGRGAGAVCLLLLCRVGIVCAWCGGVFPQPGILAFFQMITKMILLVHVVCNWCIDTFVLY